MATPLTDSINALTTYANSVTGESDTTLSDAVYSLASGYGSGGGAEAKMTTLLSSSAGNVKFTDVCDGTYELAHTDGFLYIRASGSTAPSTGSYTLNNYIIPYKNKAEITTTGYRRYYYKSGKVAPDTIVPFDINSNLSGTYVVDGKLQATGNVSSYMGGTGTKITVIDIPVDWSAIGL